MTRAVLILALLWQSAFAGLGPTAWACDPHSAHCSGKACPCCPLCLATPEGCGCCVGAPAPEPISPAAAKPTRAPLDHALPVAQPAASFAAHRPNADRAASRAAVAGAATGARRLAVLCVRVV